MFKQKLDAFEKINGKIILPTKEYKLKECLILNFEKPNFIDNLFVFEELDFIIKNYGLYFVPIKYLTKEICDKYFYSNLQTIKNGNNIFYSIPEIFITNKYFHDLGAENIFKDYLFSHKITRYYFNWTSSVEFIPIFYINEFMCEEHFNIHKNIKGIPEYYVKKQN